MCRNIVLLNCDQSILSPLQNLEVGAILYYLVVTDADIGSNADIRFTQTSPLGGTFAVDPSSGVITLSRSLDFDTAQSYSIVVTAEVSSFPPRSACFEIVNRFVV